MHDGIIIIARHASGACNVNSRWTDCPSSSIECGSVIGLWSNLKLVLLSDLVSWKWRCHNFASPIDPCGTQCTSAWFQLRCTRFCVEFCNKPVTYAHCWKLRWESVWWQPEVLCSASILCCNHVDDILGVFGIMLLEGRKPCIKLGAEITILLARVLGKLQCFGADYVLLCTQIYMCVERERTLFHIHVCVAIMCF